MCAGLPIVASSEIGCAPDLLRAGGNAFLVPGGNIAALADALRSLIVDAPLRERMGQVSRDVIVRWSYAECAAGLSAALASVGVAVNRSGAILAAQ
jgi:glycosyltransferase involved in cell wall biosynthesis